MSTDHVQLSIVLLMSLNVIPVAGLVIKAAFKALDTAWHLHKPVCAFYIYHCSLLIYLYIVLPFKEDVKGANCNFYCRASVGLSM